jgi:hypothetical protein
MQSNKKMHVPATLLCAAIALSPVAVLAQSPATSPAMTPFSSTTTDDRAIREEHHVYDWIGLIGLLGVGGLMRKRNDVHRHDTTASRTGVRP